MDVIRKDKYNIMYNHFNDYIMPDWGQSDDEDMEEGKQSEFNMDSVDPSVSKFGSQMDAESTLKTQPKNHQSEIQTKEDENYRQKKRVREKQKLFLELIKQQVSITKLKERNDDMENKQRSDSKDKIRKVTEQNQQSKKLKLPLLFVECQGGSKIKISQDDTKMHLKLTTDQKFALSDENYLFECMGLTKTNSKELSRIFDKQIIDFLKSSELVQVSLPSSKSCTSQSNYGSDSIEGLYPQINLSNEGSNHKGSPIMSHDVGSEHSGDIDHGAYRTPTKLHMTSTHQFLDHQVQQSKAVSAQKLPGQNQGARWREKFENHLMKKMEKLQEDGTLRCGSEANSQSTLAKGTMDIRAENANSNDLLYLKS